jgi:opacity protein-like surface antigen
VKSFPPKPDSDTSYSRKSEYYGSLYRLVLHEVLVQAELEKPLSHEVPSEYSISSRLMVHLEDFPEWVPGAAPSTVTRRMDITVHTHPEWTIKVGGGGGFNSRGLVGADLSVQLPVNFGHSQFKFGLTVGYDYGIGQASGQGNGWLLPILATAEYDFRTSGSIHPFMRIGQGITFVHETTTYQGFDPFTGESADPIRETSTNVVAASELTPGFYFGNHEQFLFEIPMSFRENGTANVMAKFGMKF